jgi:hypothetical protein
VPSPLRPGHARVVFEERWWAADLTAATPAGRRAAQAWRSSAEHDGVRVGDLRPCQAEAADGTRLPQCLKLYVPFPAGAWGAVFLVAIDVTSGRGILDLLAFGLRHPPAGRRASVYEIAHRRLHRPASR